MANIIIKAMLDTLKRGGFCQADCFGCCGDGKRDITCEIVRDKFEKELFKHFQPKIPDSWVVMSEEEWKQRAYVNAMQNDICKKCRDTIAKETVPIAMYDLAKAFHDEKCAEFEKLCYDYHKLQHKLDDTNEKIASEIADYIAQTRKETATECYAIVDEKCDPEFNICDGRLYHVGYQAALRDIKKCLEERFGEEIKK